MNIKQAKQQIKNAVKAYLTKDEFGAYKLPLERQRPIFLLGAPGIGKTAIMAQVASELNIALVSYSMTHHTRQSAIGLPFIVKKDFGGEEYDVSEYTMSEIIASVYETMEKTGMKEGILFLDEINCVSETLAPAMLQFLQYKIFGRHRLPDGWIVVTAGNPPEYNKSVRDFDMATWDRLKRIEIEPDYEAWHTYAQNKGEHPAVLTYLSLKKDDFYKVETTVYGKSFVTARGWDDLSLIMQLYEENGIKVDELLISQYVQNKRIAKDFSIYLDLYNKYRADYKIEAILNGAPSEDIIKRAQAARFDERLSLTGMLTDAVIKKAKEVTYKEAALSSCLEAAKDISLSMTKPGSSPSDVISKEASLKKEELLKRRTAHSLTEKDEYVLESVCAFLENAYEKCAEDTAAAQAGAHIKALFDAASKKLKALSKETVFYMNNALSFVADALGEDQELLVMVSELTLNAAASEFINKFGCENYFKYNKSLMFYERGVDIKKQIEELES